MIHNPSTARDESLPSFDVSIVRWSSVLLCCVVISEGAVSGAPDLAFAPLRVVATLRELCFASFSPWLSSVHHCRFLPVSSHGSLIMAPTTGFHVAYQFTASTENETVRKAINRFVLHFRNEFKSAVEMVLTSWAVRPLFAKYIDGISTSASSGFPIASWTWITGKSL